MGELVTVDLNPNHETWEPKKEEPKKVDPKGPPTTSVLSRRDALRSGSAATRLEALPSELNFGVRNSSVSKDIPLISTDEFVGAGVAAPKISAVETIGSNFNASPAEVSFNTYSRLQKLPVRYVPTTNGVHRANLDLNVNWTDGRETKLHTTLVGEAHGVETAKTTTLEPTLTNLDLAYTKAAILRQGLFEKRALGAREALNNLNVADQPSLGEALVSSLATAALGFASGYISTALVERFSLKVDRMLAQAAKLEGFDEVKALSDAAKSGFQTALDDGGKDAFGAVQNHLGGHGGGAAVEFFTSQEEALIDAKTNIATRAAESAALTKSAIEKAPETSRSSLIRHHINIADGMTEELASAQSEARSIQYRSSLTRWMLGLAQDKFGESSSGDRPGTDLGKGVDVSPKEHLFEPHKGVVNFSFRAKRQRPLGGTAKIKGMTEAALRGLQADRKLRVRDLKMPIVASGYLAAGADVNLANNEIAFGKNEAGTVFWKGHDDALEILQDLTNTATIEEAVRVVIREDLEPRLLEHVTSES